MESQTQSDVSPFHGNRVRPLPAAPDAIPRGIRPSLLLEQVRQTVPYIFAPEWEGVAPFLDTLRETGQMVHLQGEVLFDHFRYFDLCLSAHHATVASFLSTDVDNQIRFKLWAPSVPQETRVEMAMRVLESYHWDAEKVSTRGVRGPESGARMSGHNGEWFSTAVAAYGAVKRRVPELSEVIRELILTEANREAGIYLEFKRARDGIGLLKSASVIAHNLGDLDRVMDMWNLPAEDPLRETIYKAGHQSKHQEALTEAGALSKAQMAIECHRCFALRGPRCLRAHPDLLLPIAPFFDEWGSKVARHPGLAPEEVGEVATALVEGWERLAPGTVGYARALAGIEEAFGGINNLCQVVPARAARKIKAGGLRALASIPRARFEGHWNHAALKFVGAL